MNRKVQIGAAKVLWHFQKLCKREFFSSKNRQTPSILLLLFLVSHSIRYQYLFLNNI